MCLWMSEGPIKEVESLLVYLGVCKHLMDHTAHIIPYELYKSLLRMVVAMAEQINGAIFTPATAIAEKVISKLF